MKKLLIMLMALMLVMLSFTACGDDDDNGGGDGGSGGSSDTGNGSGAGDTGSGDSTACQHTNTTVTKPRVPGTCTDRELTAEITCNDCNKVIQAQEEGKRDYDNHCKYPEGNFTFTAAVSPTCTEKGNGPKVQCKHCNKILDMGVAIDALGHDWVANAEVPATCTRPGSTGGQHCSVCFIENPENRATVVPALNHKVGEESKLTEDTTFEAVSATCTEQGISKKYHCSLCDEDVFEYTPAKNHMEDGVSKLVKDDAFVAVDATCTEKGKSERYVCSLCGAEEFTETDMIAHNYGTVEEQAATCVAEGHKAGEKCTVCGDIKIGCEVIPVDPTAHGEKEEYSGTGVDAANVDCTHRVCTTLGEKCKDCGEVTKEPVYGDYGTNHTAGHTEVEVIIKEAACGVAGEKQFKCSECGAFILAEGGTDNKKEEIPALDCVDEDEDGFCDACGECMGHVDAEPAGAVDGKCDVCGEDMPAAEPAA
ncbi:MAG: hypothetical protein IJ488_08210 [Clostridia bacterium]|nr:hypothetical protein [Clostridia bacterium]